MVTSKLLGGLGNQMFQYAIGKTLSVKNNTDLSLDLRSLLHRDAKIDFTFRDFELDIFKITPKKIITQSSNGLFNKIYQKLFPVTHIKETSMSFDPKVMDFKGNLYLDGFWQCPRYFEEISDQLLIDFTFKYEPNLENSRLIEQINETNSISIHFRRGDYISNSKANSYHGTCSDEYYYKAIDLVKKKVDSPHFFVFSDDLNYVKNEFNFFNDTVIYVDFNSGKESYNDMRLMAACKHNIVANSSFSWWGAWLNQNIEKVVIAPQHWLLGQDIDIIPSSWIKI